MIWRTFQDVDTYKFKVSRITTFLRSEFWRFIQLQTDDDKEPVANSQPAQSCQQHAAHTCAAD